MTQPTPEAPCWRVYIWDSDGNVVYGGNVRAHDEASAFKRAEERFSSTDVHHVEAVRGME